MTYFWNYDFDLFNFRKMSHDVIFTVLLPYPQDLRPITYSYYHCVSLHIKAIVSASSAVSLLDATHTAQSSSLCMVLVYKPYPARP